MADFFLQFLKVNLLAAGAVGLVLAAEKLWGKRWTAAWKYVIWLAVSLLVLLPVRLPPAAGALEWKLPKQVVFRNTEQSREEKISAAEPESADQSSAAISKGRKEGAENAETAGTRTEYQGVSTKKILETLAGIWLSGVCLTAGFRIWEYLRLQKDLKRCRIRMSGESADRIYQRVSETFCPGKAPVLQACAYLDTPLLAGLFRPRLYLPDREYTEAELEMIFCHELGHFRRKDLWYKLLLLAAGTAGWFNPALYRMRREAEKDVEFLCDELIMKERNPKERIDYGYLLLKTAEGQCRAGRLTAGLSDGAAGFKQRLQHVMTAGTRGKGRVLSAVLLLALLSAHLMLNCSVAKFSVSRWTADPQGNISLQNGAQREERMGSTQGEHRELKYDLMAKSPKEVREKAEKLIQELVLQEAAPSPCLPEYEKEFENGATYLSLESRADYNSLSINTEDPRLSAWGLYVGQSAEEAEEILAAQGWYPEFLTGSSPLLKLREVKRKAWDGRHDMYIYDSLSYTTDSRGERVTAWYWYAFVCGHYIYPGQGLA